jgi:ABC-2 type transport system permease protein
MDMNKQLTGFWTVIHYTVRKLLLSKRIYISLLIILFIVAIMAYASTLDLTEQEIKDGYTKIDGGVDLLDALILFFFMPVMAMIYGSSLVRDEMDDRSITAIVTSPMERTVTFIGYYIGLAISVSIIMLIILTAGFLSFFGAIGFDGAGGIYGPFAALMIIGAFAYSSLFIMISVLLDRPLYFGLFYAFIWEAFIGSIPGNIRLLAVKHYIRSLGAHWIDHGGITTYDATPVGNSIWVIVVFSIVVFVIGTYLFREKEFT